MDSSVTDNNSLKEDFVIEILPKIERILKSRFPNNPARQRIKRYRDRLSFAAPCCGDSASNDFKKRGNIILEGKFKNMYKCHNCGVCMSVNNFLKQYGESLSLSSVDYIISSKHETTNDSNEIANYLFDTDTIERFAIDRDVFKKALNLVECNEFNVANVYLRKRCQFDFSKFLFSEKHKLLFLLNLTKSGKIFGIQISHLDPKYKGPKYKTYNTSSIYKILFRRDDVVVPEEVDRLSMIFNILLVNYEYAVTVLEGPMDSFLTRNSIALCGAGKHIEFKFECRYLFDNDATGRQHAVEYMKKGYSVFMWDKLKSDILFPDRKKWDVNDLIIWSRENNIKMPHLDSYFSSDELDMIMI